MILRNSAIIRFMLYLLICETQQHKLKGDKPGHNKIKNLHGPTFINVGPHFSAQYYHNAFVAVILNSVPLLIPDPLQPWPP